MTQRRKNDTVGLLLLWTSIAWIVYLIDFVCFRGKLGIVLGIVPRDFSHLIGILCAPFLHANLEHLLHNTLMFIVLGVLVASTRREHFHSISLIIMSASGLGVWLFARGGTGGEAATHIGASGVLYGYVGYLVTEVIGGRQHNPVRAAIAVMLFASLYKGMFPGPKAYISWEAHLCGCLAGILASHLLRKRE